MFHHAGLKKFIFSFLAVLIAASSFVIPGYAVSASEIEEVRRQRDIASEEKKAQQAIVDELSLECDDVISKKMALEEKVSLTRQQIDLNDQEIAMYDEMIAEKAAEVDQAKAREVEQLEKYRARVRAMEENGSLNVLVLLAESGSLADFLSALDDAGDIMQSDRKLEDEYIAAREAHEAAKREFEEYKAGLVAIQDVLIDERNQLEIEITEEENTIAALQEEISANTELVNEIEARWNQLNNELYELQLQYEAEHAPGSLAGTDGFIWPCGTYYLTSREGSREHPVTGDTRYHSGDDIGCASGDPIWASAAGTVTLAGWNGDYGNCVMIDHGNGYTTVYAHLSSVDVSAGQSVSSGQTIGACGSTGLATGAHLHFEIRNGGGCCDPEDFFDSSSFQYAPDA